MVRNTSSSVIDTLCDQAREEDAMVTGLFCDFRAQPEQTVTNIMGEFLKQLVCCGREIPKAIQDEFRERKKEVGEGRPILADLMRMLKTTIASLPRIFICIDALDQCLPKYLPQLLESLSDIIQESPKTRIFLTGRPYIKEAIQGYFAKAVVIHISTNPDEVRSFVLGRLDMDIEPEAMDDALRADIVKMAEERMSDTCVRAFGVFPLSVVYVYSPTTLSRFLLVSLSVDTILGEVTIGRRREKLEEMTRNNGLSDVYTAKLNEVKAQKGNRAVLGMNVLMWVLYSERTIFPQELCYALGVEIGSTDLDLEKVPSFRTLISSCLGLVTVKSVSKSSSIMQLVHSTLQEHLLSDPTLFDSPHSKIAEVCLTYLNYAIVRDLSPTLDSAPSTIPLLEYASCNWGEHARRGMTENVRILALRLLDKFDEHISARLLLSRYNQDGADSPYFPGRGGPIGFTGLHGVAFLGIVEILAPVFEMKEWDVNATDNTGSTAFTWAVRRGREEMVKILLEREEVNPDHADPESGRTPLTWAAIIGHEEVVRMLLEREDVNPNHKDTQYSRTPLSWAVEYEHEGVVKMLLERNDVAHDGVAWILPERDNATSDEANRDCQAPLPPWWSRPLSILPLPFSRRREKAEGSPNNA